MHQNQQLTQYDKAPPALLSINRPFFYHHYFNSWFFSDLIWSNGAPSALIPITGSIQINISTAGSSWSNGSPVSIPFYHRSIQAKFWFFSAEITPWRQRYMKIFGDFHIEEYFHLFFFMNWILNFISIHSIKGMNKWSILIIYSFMK